MKLEKEIKKFQGFSLIEVLVVMFIVAISFTMFYGVSVTGTKFIIESKNKLAAAALANEKMEIVRNLSYEKIGTQGSIDIPGNLPQEETVVANGRTYQVSTSVRYADDPMDGTISTTPADLIPNDYKVVRIIISWVDSAGNTKKVSSTSRFVPPGLETSNGGSPLSINVIDGETLLPVPQASVHITNTATTPQINDTIQTDNAGHIILPAAKISSNNHVSITKNEYETITTMDSSATFIPIYGHISVVSNFLNTYNYILNKLATLTVKTADYQNNVIGNISFSIGGGKIIGHDNTGANVYSMANATTTTDVTTGEKQYQNINSGNYNIIMGANAQYEFIDFDPSVSPFFLPPNSNSTYIMRLADKNIKALFLEVRNSDSPSSPIAGASVTLSREGTDIFTDKLSSLRGIVFYPDGATPLTNNDYTLKIVASGYAEYTHSVEIDKLTHVVVNLTNL
jgi:prepilin-type N-terminal cleavage/methylation domain-containing protein